VYHENAPHPEHTVKLGIRSGLNLKLYFLKFLDANFMKQNFVKNGKISTLCCFLLLPIYMYCAYDLRTYFYPFISIMHIHYITST